MLMYSAMNIIQPTKYLGLENVAIFIRYFICSIIKISYGWTQQNINNNGDL